MFGLKGIFDSNALTKGLVIQDNKESLPDEAIVECDGFIQHEALLRKDFACAEVSDIVDNIDYIPPTEMPICIAGEDDSEIDYDNPNYPWTAPEPSEEVTENSDDYILQSKLRWATGSITSMNPGQTSYLSVLGNFGNTFWSLNTTGLTQGSITHSLTSGFNYGNKAKYKTSDDCAGSFYVEARDAFKTINRTISISTGALFGLHVKDISNIPFWVIFNSSLEFIGVYPYASYNAKTRLNEGVINSSYIEEGDITTYQVTKSGSLIIGPYSFNSSTQTGNILYCYVVSSSTWAGTIGSYNLFTWSYSEKVDGVFKYNSYLITNDSTSTIELLTNNPYWGFGSRTTNYISLVIFLFDTLSPSLTLKIMNSSGDTISSIISDTYTMSWDSGIYYINISGTNYRVNFAPWNNFVEVEEA